MKITSRDDDGRWARVLEHPRWDAGLALLAPLTLWLGADVTGIARPPTGQSLAAFVEGTSTGLWALFAGLLTALVFFYSVTRGPSVETAEARFGDSLYASWASALTWTLLLAITSTVIVRPLDWVGWVLAYAWVMIGIKAMRVMWLALSFVGLMRKDWSSERRRKTIQVAEAEKPEFKRAGLG